MSDLRIFLTICCNHKFWGMNHSPEYKGMCRNCDRAYAGEVEVKK